MARNDLFATKIFTILFVLNVINYASPSTNESIWSYLFELSHKQDIIESNKELIPQNRDFKNNKKKYNIHNDIKHGYNNFTEKQFNKKGFESSNSSFTSEPLKVYRNTNGIDKFLGFILRDPLTTLYNCSDKENKTRINRLITKFWTHNKAHFFILRLWKSVMIWSLAYLVVAVPLWCTRGWCCCCLRCKFFKPNETINEAKKFLEANPPGVLQDKKGGVIFYEPTNNEKESYEKFGHLMRTI